MGMRKFLSTHGVPTYKVPTLFATFLRELKEQSASLRLNDGIADAVDAIRGVGVRQCVVSSNDTQTIRDCLNQHQIDHCFEDVCGTSRIFGKESTIRSVVKSMELGPRDALYVGDEIRDIEAANSAGVDVAAVGWGLNSRRALLKRNPTYIVAQPAELPELLLSAETSDPTTSVRHTQP